MNFFPELKIGLLNIWPATLLILFSAWLIPLKNPKARTRLFNVDWCSKKQNIILWTGSLIMFSMIILSFWVPIQNGRISLYAGGSIFIIGYFTMLFSYFNYLQTAGNKKHVKGFYNISRNPIYFSTDIAFLGLAIAGTSLIMVLLVVLHFIITHQVILAEEKHFEKQYSKTYLKYKNKVRRYL